VTTSQTPRTSNIPPDVAHTASAQQLGTIVDSRQPPRRLNTAGFLLTVGVGSFVLLVGLLFAAPFVPGILLGMVRLMVAVLIALGLACLGLGVKTLFTPSRSFFIYERGFVYRSGRRIQAFGWSEVQALRPGFITKGGLRGRLVRYDILRPGAKPIPVPVSILHGGHDRFADRLVGIVDRLGRPIG
jgi:hypothetical protein